jgi:RNA polymerase sigma factor (TIGR02999 family)
MDAQHQITEQLVALRNGADPAAWDRLVPLVYDELRAIARRQLHRESRGHTLSTTALVHEAYLKFADQDRVGWRDRNHFYVIAAKVMRRILVDHARAHLTSKRGGALRRVPLESTAEARVNGPFTSDALLAPGERAQTLVALDEALSHLDALDERLVAVVECRFFGGLTEEETAIALGVTARTVRRDWVKAKAWLRNALEDSKT